MGGRLVCFSYVVCVGLRIGSKLDKKQEGWILGCWVQSYLPRGSASADLSSLLQQKTQQLGKRMGPRQCTILVRIMKTELGWTGLGGLDW